MAAFVVFDITASDSFETAKKWVEELNEKAPANIIITLVGNKVDLEDSREVKKELAEEYAKSVGLAYKEVSAKEDINVSSLFMELAKQLP